MIGGDGNDIVYLDLTSFGEVGNDVADVGIAMISFMVARGTTLSSVAWMMTRFTAKTATTWSKVTMAMI